MTFLGQKSVKNGQLYHLLDVRKSSREARKQEILQQCSENSRSQIVFRTDIFRKLTLGAPEYTVFLRPSTVRDARYIRA